MDLETAGLAITRTVTQIVPAASIVSGANSNHSNSGVRVMSRTLLRAAFPNTVVRPMFRGGG
jgi:hypothetical protein